MTFNPDIHQRRSIRLRDFDYAVSGAYFVTICAQGRECLFGAVVDGVMMENDAGNMVKSVWLGLSERFPGMEPDAFVMMPNHLHFILFLVGAPLVSARSSGEEQNRAPTRGAPTVGEIVGAFKSMTTYEYAIGVATSRWPPFAGRLWQRNYFERVIRNDADLDKFRDYILTNPARWVEDAENPRSLQGR